jgi:hypothetical protein
MDSGLEVVMALAVLVVPLIGAWWLLSRAMRPRKPSRARRSRK